ncbi:MAG TPA: acyl-CoA dehydrogenase family protein [Solirubrobacteraceae bacterium]|jgi:alkylation response protein AidB-like acyl-CoA dehydrogenase|nr:acyl-CoA dehydrogenase family protein [Solirubrobacteraceae bacterium]
MDFGLSDDQRDIQRTARDLLAERAGVGGFSSVRECAEQGRLDEDLWRELCGLGWPGIAVSEAYGGQGLGLVELSVLCEELGRAVAAVPFLPTALAACAIEQAGSEEQRERWLPGLAEGELLGAVGTARDGVAELVVGAPGAGVLVLLEEGASRVRARARVCAREEVGVEPVRSIDPTRPCARVSAESGAGETLEGEVGAGVDRALVAVSAEIVGVSDRALAMTVDYVKERKQFGVPVGSYQAVSHRCAQMLLDTERARSLTAQAAWAADADPQRLGEAAAMAKACASEAGVEVTSSAIQAHGGIGFTWEADVHWLYKRALLDSALLGGPKQQRARLAGILAERPIAQ